MKDSYKVISEAYERELLKLVKPNDRHYLMVLLMLDAGLRASEVASFHSDNVDASKRLIKVRTLKKRDKELIREIPMTFRLQEAIAKFVTKPSFSSGYFFKSKSKRGHVGRVSIWLMLSRKTGRRVSPHDLRHTFATRIVKTTSIVSARDLLGHASTQTTEIYTHSEALERYQAIDNYEHRNWFEKLKKKFKKRKPIHIRSNVTIPESQLIGRKKELAELNKHFVNRQNVILLGAQGLGKSRLLGEFDEERILKLDDVRYAKKTISNLLIHLQSREGKTELLEFHLAQVSLSTYLQKNSVQNLCRLLMVVCDKDEFTLMIDDLSSVTKTGVQVLELLKDHFHIMAAARKIKVAHSSFLTNFATIKVEPLTRSEGSHLVYNLSRSFLDKIENYEAFKTHILNQSDCNPLFIKELIDRFAKEPYVREDMVSEVQHFMTKRQFDFTVPVVLFISSLMVLRYIGGELGDDSGAFRLFGGMFMVFAIFARQILTVGKRKFI